MSSVSLGERASAPATAPGRSSRPALVRLPTSWQGVVAVVATVACLVPVAVVLVRVAGRDLVLLPDTSVIDLRVRDVFGGDLPLVGPYSRFRWNHPGPLLYYLLSPLHALSGGAAWATLAGNALAHGLVIVLVARLAWRRGGLTLVLLALTATLLADAAVGTRLLLDAWNPNLAVPLFVLFALQVWSVVVGDRWPLVAAAIVGSFLAATHAGYAPFVLAGAVWVAALLWIDVRRERVRVRDLRAPVALAAGCALVLWLPAIVDELARSGNLGLLWDYATQGRGRRVGLGDAAGLVAAEYRLLPPWITPDASHDDVVARVAVASPAWLLVAALLLGIGSAAARRVRSRGAARLLALVTLLVVVGILTAARAELPRFTYLFDWRVPLATLLVASVAWALALLLAHTGRSLLRGLGAAAVVVCLTWTVTGYAVDIAEAPLSEAELARTVRRFTPELVRVAGDRTVLVRDASTKLSGLFDGLVDRLDREGVDVRVDPQLEFVYGDRTIDRTAADAVWHVSDEGLSTSVLSGQDRARVVASSSPLGPAEERELGDLQRRLVFDLGAAGGDDLIGAVDRAGDLDEVARVPGIDAAEVTRVRQLLRAVERSGGCRCAVIELPPDSAFFE